MPAPAEVLTYNGVILDIINTKQISRRHVFTDDKTTYLWTEWTFHVRAYLNPQVISYVAAAAGLTYATGRMPAQTDPVVRAVLAAPRKQLTFSQDGNLVLSCPGPGFTVDAQNGPQVEEFNVLQSHGTKTWVVEIKIVCRVRECPFSKSGPTSIPLIANRFRRIMDTDEDYLSNVTTIGECTFDSAWLASQATATWPDQYRIDLMQPIPLNCKRDNINVEAAPDGTTYRYSFRDQERHFNTPSGTRVECYQTEFYSQVNILSAVAGAGLNAVPAMMTAAGNLNPFAAVAAGANGAFNTVQQQIPKYYSHILVRAWGHRGIAKTTLLNSALGMAFERVPNTRNVEFLVSMDRVGKMVEVQLTNRTGPEELSIQLAQGFAGLLAPVLPVLGPLANLPDGVNRALANFTTGPGGVEDSPGIFYGQKPAIGNIQPPNSGGTRGTLLCQLIAASLHSPCQIPPRPVQDLTLTTTDKRVYQ